MWITTIAISIILATIWIFNPYRQYNWRNCVERWTAREKSHGHPYYWKLRFQPDPKGKDWYHPYYSSWKDESADVNQDTYNRFDTHAPIRNWKNVILLQ